jgi:arabinose-5-phosphate isomerase
VTPVAVLERKRFRAEDFAVLHPGGNLGRRLMKIEELTRQGASLPLVADHASLQETLQETSEKRLSITGVVDRAGILVGAITDGDLRRALQSYGELAGRRAGDLMSTNPKTVPIDALAEQALATMEKHSITSLFVLSEDGGRPVGIVHMHDLIKAGVV